ncbi:hypothetical protein BC937DRAFT_87366 [Endogone sp. FLAS-F59071]|nr:hypothetical protein BC937DRAFT_87366 [Endogone sp. FLAS-F59071]|eukprot:RUS19511.1 hypothetical protein BC937DRAFT_87366 [Endogone sp. FLAS-F59071]
MRKQYSLKAVRNDRKRDHESANGVDLHQTFSLPTFLTYDPTTFEFAQSIPKRHKTQHVFNSNTMLIRNIPKKTAERPSVLCLPDELLLIVLECMSRDIRAICALARSCRRLYHLSTLDLVWRPAVANLYRPTSRRHVKCYGQPPQHNLLRFMRNLAGSEYCFRCGVRATSKTELGVMGEKVMEVLARRMPGHRVYQQDRRKRKIPSKFSLQGCLEEMSIISNLPFPSALLCEQVTEKQLASVKYVPKPWYGKQSYLYLKSTIEQLSLERWGSERALKQAKSERKPRNKTPRDFWHKFYDPFFYEYFDDHRYILPPYFAPTSTITAASTPNAISLHHPAANVTVAKTSDTAASVIAFGNVSVNISIGSSGGSHLNTQAGGASAGTSAAQGYVAVNTGAAYISLSVNVSGGGWI